MPHVHPVLVTRQVEQCGMWLPRAPADSIDDPADPNLLWVHEETLRDLESARTGQCWTRVDAVSLEDALVHAGYAELDGGRSALRGTRALAQLLEEHDGSGPRNVD